MKNKVFSNQILLKSENLKHLFRIMKLLNFFLFVAIFSLSATNSFSQNEKVYLNKNNVKLEEILSEIESQTNYLFIYDDQVKVDQKVSVKAQGEATYSVLNSLFANTNIAYRMQGTHILLTKLNDVNSTKQVPTKQIRGTVVDKNGDTLIGVSVAVKGTTSGAMTDIDGKYAIEVKEGDIIEFSYLGFKAKEVKISDQSTIDIVLEENDVILSDVVVTALGIKREEKALSYNVQQIKQDEFVRVKDPNFVNSLNGKVAGVTINKSGSGIGGASRVVIRGAKSLEGDNNVLYVIDGIPLFNTNMGSTDSGVLGEGRAGSEGIADFNPEDIESLSILSGPSAAALYGSSAANGAILITTKKGKEGKLQITLSSSSEFSQPLMMPKFQTRYGNRIGAYDSWGDKLPTPSSYNPKDDFFNTGTNFINAITLTTGNKQNQTFASLASTNADGIVPNNSYDRLNLTIRNSSSFFKDKVRLDLGASYIKQKDRNMVSQGLYWNPIVAAYLFPRGESFDAIKTFETYNEVRKFATQNWPISEGTYATQNPYWTAYRNPMETNKNRFMFNAGITYEILDWLNISGRYRIDHTYADLEHKVYASSSEKFAGKKGNYRYSQYKDSQEYTDFLANINKYINDFSIAANIGFSYTNYKALERGLKGDLAGPTNGFYLNNISPNKTSVIEEGGDQSVKNIAVFASAEFGWKSMLYLTLTGRNDWNSRLVNAPEESFFYPSIGLSGVVSEMVKLPNFISYLKVRGSYTEVGSPISKSGFTPGTITTPIIGGIMQETLIYPFPDFKAERTNSYEFGVNLRLLNNKINFDATWYKSNTKNQTFLADLSGGTSGYEYAYLQAGNVENKGWEISLGYNDKFGDFSIASSLAYTKNTNVIKEMVKDYVHPLSPDPITIEQVSKERGRTILKVGGSISDIYASQFLKKDSQGYVEIKEDGSYGLEQGGEPVYLGKTTPDFTLGWNNSLRYKNFGLSFLINARFGGIVTSSTQAILDQFGVSEASAEARDNGGALIPNQGRVDAEKYYKMIGTGESATAGYYTYSATNIRLQELSFSYTFPASWFKNVISELSLSFIANNPWMIYCKAPHDPELTPSTSTYGQGNDYFMQPSLRSFGFGVKVKF